MAGATMIVGDPGILAIESQISEAYEQPSLMALGSFVIHVGGQPYGRQSPDSSILACSFGEIEDRVADRGTHVAPFSAERDAGKIADAFLNSIYGEAQEESYFGVPLAEFREFFSAASADCMWAPDGDEAFDDGSCVLQFDVGTRVRLIAFKRSSGYRHDRRTLSDVWLRADDFYKTLLDWRDAFRDQWVVAKGEPAGRANKRDITSDFQ
jgi:hypothetical protein